MRQKKVLSILLTVCMLLCSTGVVWGEEAEEQSHILYDMLEQNTWKTGNASFVRMDTTTFPDRGEVLCAEITANNSLNIYDAFQEEIGNGKLKLSFEFYVDEASDYPNLYFSTANMVPFSMDSIWNTTPAFYAAADGSVKYYGGYGSSGAIWDITDANGKIEKGRWHKMENIINLGDVDTIAGYLDGEKLYDLVSGNKISGLIFQMSKSGGSRKLYFDNIMLTKVQNDLSVSFAYGEGACAVMEFSQPILADNAKDVKAYEVTTGEEAEILAVSQVSGKAISYQMSGGKPYAEYQFVFGEEILSEYGSRLPSSVAVTGTIGASEDYRLEIPVNRDLLEDNFDSYGTMAGPYNALTLDKTKWTEIYSPDRYVEWGFGPFVNANHQLQIHNFWAGAGRGTGVRGKLSDTALKSGTVSVTFDAAYCEKAEQLPIGNHFRVNLGTYPLFELRAESMAVYENQSGSQQPTVLTEVVKENTSVLQKYTVTLDFKTETIIISIDGAVVSELTMCEGIKTVGVTDISFWGIRGPAANVSVLSDCALIDNLSATLTDVNYDYAPGVAGVRFIEADGIQKVANEKISPLTEKITVKFSEPVETAYLDTIIISGNEGEISYTGRWDDAANIWEMTLPQYGLQVKTPYQIVVPDTICDLNGLPLVEAYTCRFSTGSNSRAVNFGLINSMAEQNDVQGIATLIAKDPEGVGIAAPVFDAADTSGVAALILDYASQNPLTDSEETVLNLQKLVLMECANNNRVANLWGDKLTYGVSDTQVAGIMEGRLAEHLTKELCGKGFTSISQFDSALKAAAILVAINYADGEAQVKSVLDTFESTISGGGSLNLTDEKYHAVYVHGAFASLDALKLFVLNDIPPTQGGGSMGPSYGGGGGGGGGGSFVSSSTGGAVESANDKTYVDDKKDEKQEAPIFSDIEDYPWAEEAICALYAKGVIAGREKQLFVPGASVLREETAKMLVEAFRFYIKGSIAFEDVKEEDWFYPYIVRAYNSGVVLGISETEFGSGRAIIRQDLAVMIYNALRAATALPEQTEEYKPFADQEAISGYAVEAVKVLRQAGIVSGDESGFFHPQSCASRAETAKMIYLATAYLK